MITRLRKLGDGPWPWVDVEHEADECVFCEVASRCLKAAGAVIFFETEAGAVQRTECIAVAPTKLATFFCIECSRDEALQEIAAAVGR